MEPSGCDPTCSRAHAIIASCADASGEGDFTSGVYARALMHGDVTLDQLGRCDREAIRAGILGGRHEDFFLDRWQDHRRALIAKRARVRSFDLGELVVGLQRLICIHLGSRGYK